MTSFENELEKNGYIVFTNKGVSMLPLLRQNRDVMVILAKRDGFKKNDAVLFKRDSGQYVMHRIRKVYGDGTYGIIGDNCIKGERVREDQIIGILSQVKRGEKTVSVTDFGYRIYVALVPVMRPFLRPKWFVLRVLSKIRRTFFKKK